MDRRAFLGLLAVTPVALFAAPVAKAIVPSVVTKPRRIVLTAAQRARLVAAIKAHYRGVGAEEPRVLDGKVRSV